MSKKKITHAELLRNLSTEDKRAVEIEFHRLKRLQKTQRSSYYSVRTPDDRYVLAQAYVNIIEKRSQEKPEPKDNSSSRKNTRADPNECWKEPKPSPSD